MNGYFITGTDTDAGKTHLSRALLLAAADRGVTAIGYKPIESGCPDARTPGPDAKAMARASGTVPHTSYTLERPVAPHLAARESGVSLSLAPIEKKAKELARTAELLLIEGAGGLLVPLSDHETMADLAAVLRLPVLIAAPNRLGAINHSLLTIAAARTHQLNIAAVVLIDVIDGAGQGLENAEAIASHGQVRVLSLPHTRSNDQLRDEGRRLLDALLADAKASEESV